MRSDIRPKIKRSLPEEPSENKPVFSVVEAENEIPLTFPDPQLTPVHLEKESSQLIEEKLSAFQQQQANLMQQTAAELENLKRQLEESLTKKQQSGQPDALRQEIAELKQAISRLEEEKAAETEKVHFLKTQLHFYQEQIETVLDSVKKSLYSLPALLAENIPSASQRPPVQTIAQEENPTPPPVAQASEEPAAMATSQPASEPAAPTMVQEEIAETALVEAKPKKEKKGRPERKKLAFPVLIMKRAAFGFVLIGAIGYLGWITLADLTRPGSLHDQSEGEVAGATTEQVQPPSAGAVLPTEAPNPSVQYPESFADKPFAETIWEQTVDSEFGIVMKYPKNTSTRIRIVGSNNLWFLRKNGYLMKITKIETAQSLDQWWEGNQGDFDTDYILSKVTFKGQPAWYAETIAHNPNSGNQYFTKHGNAIYQIWVKEEPANSDDGQRIAAMLESIRFLTN